MKNSRRIHARVLWIAHPSNPNFSSTAKEVCAWNIKMEWLTQSGAHAYNRYDVWTWTIPCGGMPLCCSPAGSCSNFRLRGKGRGPMGKHVREDIKHSIRSYWHAVRFMDWARNKGLHLQINKNKCGGKIHAYFNINLHKPRMPWKQKPVNASATDCHKLEERAE